MQGKQGEQGEGATFKKEQVKALARLSGFTLDASSLKA